MRFLLSLVQLGAVTYESLDHSVGMLPVQELDHLVRVLADPVLGPDKWGVKEEVSHSLLVPVASTVVPLYPVIVPVMEN